MVPTTQEKKVLSVLSREEWENSAQLGAGNGTRDALLAKGWMEEMPSVPSGIVRFRITEAGRSALSVEVPKKAKPKARLKMAPPNLREPSPLLQSAPRNRK